MSNTENIYDFPDFVAELFPLGFRILLSREFVQAADRAGERKAFNA
jgi:hypothetical protein